MTTSGPDDPVLGEKPEEDDHDLLTLTQAADRLAVAVQEEQARLDAAQAQGDLAAVEASTQRLAALSSAAERHKQVPITAVNADKFYGA